ncbi:MAG TPA: hypothetical protein VK157_05085 [Phycisphaerales bacterium]|nr:hypothetical protein [Phycisphaerales bacterium]
MLPFLSLDTVMAFHRDISRHDRFARDNGLVLLPRSEHAETVDECSHQLGLPQSYVRVAKAIRIEGVKLGTALLSPLGSELDLCRQLADAIAAAPFDTTGRVWVAAMDVHYVTVRAQEANQCGAVECIDGDSLSSLGFLAPSFDQWLCVIATCDARRRLQPSSPQDCITRGLSDVRAIVGREYLATWEQVASIFL